MTIKIKYWAFNAKTGRKPWVVTLGDKRSYFNTEAEAQKFLETINTAEATDPGMTLDTLVGSVPSEADGGLKSFKSKLSHNGNPLDFVSRQRERYDREQIVWKQYQHLSSVSQAVCDVIVFGKRFGSFKVHEITGGLVRGEVMKALEVKSINKKTNVKVLRSEKTLKGYWSGMKLIFSFAVTKKTLIERNPCAEKIDFTDYGKITGKQEKARRVETGFINAIIAAMPHPRSNENRQLLDWRLIANFAAQTGLRQGEQRPLRWIDIDLEKQFVHVTHSMTSKEEGDADVEGTKGDRVKKTNQYQKRKVPLSDSLVQELKEWFMFCGCPDAEEYVWNETSGVTINANRFSRMMAKICKHLIDIKFPVGDEIFSDYILWHEFRHYYAAERLMRNRVEPVSRALGHANVKMTQERYGHFIQDAKFDKEELESANNSSLVMVQAGAS